MKIVKYLSFCCAILFCLTNTQCEEDDCCLPNPKFCDTNVLIDDALFNEAESAEFMIQHVVIDQDCLHIEFTASGCDASTWIETLYGTSDYVSTSPVITRMIKFNLENEELCEAALMRTASFRLNNLQVEEASSIEIHLEGWDEGLIYEY